VKRSAALVVLMPPAVVTVTSTVPEPGGEVAVICEALTTLTFVAPLCPKLTAVAPVRLVPVIVTLVPPPVGPEVGLIAVTVGGGGPLPIVYGLEFTAVRSEDVATAIVSTVDCVDGFVTPSSSMVMLSPPVVVAVPKMRQVTDGAVPADLGVAGGGVVGHDPRVGQLGEPGS
jgi:hypothetical protein